MDASVETLYSLDGGERERRRTLDMIRVLKGAISASKSKEGAVIYNSNKEDRLASKRQADVFAKDVHRARVNSENQKRCALRKWSLTFERQRKIGDSLKRFDELLTSALDPKCLGHQENGSSDDIPVIHLPPADVRKLKPNDVISGTSKCPNQKMPNLPEAGGFLAQTGKRDVNRMRKSTSNTEENDSVQRSNKKDMTDIKEFLAEQKQLQEQLMTRNSISKLRRSLDREHSFYKHRMKTKLPEDPTKLVAEVEHRRKVTRRASADRFLHCTPKVEGQIFRSGELTRRNTVSVLPLPRSSIFRSKSDENS